MEGMNEVAAMAMANLGNIAVGEMNSKELQRQRDWTEEMYTKYQSPAAMIQNMIAAGMNPNAAMQAVSGTPASLQPTTAQPYAGGLGSDMVNAYYNAKIANAQEKNINADTDYKKSKTEGQNIENQWSPQMYESTVKETLARSFNMDSNSAYVNEKTRELVEMFPTAKAIQDVKLEQMRTDVSVLKKEFEHWDEKFSMEMDYMESQIGVNDANALKAQREAAIDKFILDHGYDPSSPEGKIMKMCVSEDAKEREKGYALMEGIGDVKNKIDLENKENDPVFRAQEDAEKEYKKEVSYWEREIDRIYGELDDYQNGRKKDRMGFKVGNLRNRLQEAKDAKQAAYERYTENLRRLKTNKTENTHILGVGHSSSE